ncbi:MAG TPA: DUF4418 family protein [Nitrospirota bacterium]|nr:DUF4418 family protein [Nitrospirota bacterium]
MLALFAALLPLTVFPLCEPRMHCYESYSAIMGAAAVVVAAAVMSALARGMEAPRLLSVITALGGAQFIAYPSFAIGVCGNPQMPCRYGDLPVWNLAGALVIVLSVIAFFTAKEVEP